MPCLVCFGPEHQMEPLINHSLLSHLLAFRMFPSCYVNITDIRNETNKKKKKGLNLQVTFATYSSIILDGYGNNPGCPPTFFLPSKRGHAKHMLIARKIWLSRG